jgi:hypothetical protein
MQKTILVTGATYQDLEKQSQKNLLQRNGIASLQEEGKKNSNSRFSLKKSYGIEVLP